MKIERYISKLRTSLVLGLTAAATMFSTHAGAASLSLGSGLPDVTNTNGDLQYIFTAYCASHKDTNNFGICGTSDQGHNFTGALNESLSSGSLSYTVGSLVMDDGSSGIGFLSGGAYSLTASFDGSGALTGGSIDITYSSVIGTDNDAQYVSGVMVTGSLSQAGFAGIGDSGTVEFAFDVTGGDFLSIYGALDGGTIINVFGMIWDDSGWGASASWDSASLGGRNFWQESFHATASGDNFAITAIPVPAAIWLFASGLLGLASITRRRKC